MTGTGRPQIERRGWPRRARAALYRAYYRFKYLPFAAERRQREEAERRGFVGIQVDALAYEDLERALERGYMPRLKRLIERDRWQLRRYPAGLPSATPAAQASIFYGTKGDIPAFRFYEKAQRRVVIGSQHSSMQFIRDALPDSGVLEGGSSYVNLYDGGADTAVFTLSARRRSTLNTCSWWRRSSAAVGSSRNRRKKGVTRAAFS